MYVDEIIGKEGGTIRISAEDEALDQQMDFDVEPLTDESLLSMVKGILAKRKISHYIVVQNAIHDDRSVDFMSEKVRHTLYYIQENGKVYRWPDVAISFVRANSNSVSMGTVIASSTNARPFNRRESFRISVNQYGALHFKNEPHPCMVKDISHGGFAVIFDNPKIIPSVNEICHLTWTEEISSEPGKARVSTKYELEGVVVRQQARLGKQVVIGCKLEHEPDGLRDYIQRAQTSRGIVKEAEAKVAKSGVKIGNVKDLEHDLKALRGEEDK